MPVSGIFKQLRPFFNVPDFLKQIFEDESVKNTPVSYGLLLHLLLKLLGMTAP